MNDTHWLWNSNNLPVATRLRDVASQEGNDDPEYDLMQEAADYIDELEEDLKIYEESLILTDVSAGFLPEIKRGRKYEEIVDAMESELHLMDGDTVPSEFAEYHRNIIDRLRKVIKTGKNRYGKSDKAFYVPADATDSLKKLIKTRRF